MEMGQSPPSEVVTDRQDAGIPFLQGNAEFTATHPVAKLWCHRPQKVCTTGDVLISVRAPVGAINVADQDYCIGRGLAAVRFTGAEQGYGSHALRHRSPNLRRLAQGTTFEAIGRRELGGLHLWLPPEVEQRGIAEILDTLDEAIRRTEQIIAKLKQIKQGLLNDLLSRGIDENGELRDPERHPEQFKDSTVGRLPREWDVQHLERATLSSAPICYGIVQAGPFVDGGPQVLTIADLAGDFRTGLYRTSPHIERRYARSRVEPNDVLVSIKGTIGRVAVVPAWYRGNISRDLARLRFPRSVSPSYVRHHLQSPGGQRRLELSVVGSTRAEISIYVLKRFSLPLAPQQEQEEIARQLDTAERRVRVEETEAAKLRLLRQGLMEDLLTGRVRVTELEAAV